MNHYVMVPVHLDLLHVPQRTIVAAPTADFSRLPYSTPGADVNADFANISEEVLSIPYQDQTLSLGRGVHLHWSLPDALTQGAADKQGTVVYPTVPNRWLVTRSSLDNRGQLQVERQWVVESDYLHPAGSSLNAVSIPATPAALQDDPQAYRYLGRHKLLSAWQREASGNQLVLSPLTAIGYGEQTFAAFYPNCHSVFGFHDRDMHAALPKGTQYDVIGWYADPADDALATFLERGGITKNNWARRVKNSFDWNVGDQAGPIPKGMLCYGQVQVVSKEKDTAIPTAADITIANTGTEALSALLATKLRKQVEQQTRQQASPGTSKKIEEQLEMLNSAVNFDAQQLDIYSDFLEDRHQKGFGSQPGGSLWAVTAQSGQGQPADASQTQDSLQASLPDQLAELVNEANTAQANFDAAVAEIGSLQTQLFADWYKYMITSYPAAGSTSDYPDIDVLKYYIGQADISALKQQINRTGSIKAMQGDDGWKFSAPNSTQTSLGQQLANALTALNAAVQKANKKLPKGQDPFTLQQQAAARYWRPRDLALLLTGSAIKETNRHGQDGSYTDDGCLAVQVINLGKAATVPDAFDKILEQIWKLATKGEPSPALNSWKGNPWHTLLLDWEVGMRQLQSGSNTGEGSGNYSPDYISRHFTLKENDFDLSLLPNEGGIFTGTNIYTGRAVLSGHTSSQLSDNLTTYLVATTLPAYLQANKIDPPATDQAASFLLQQLNKIIKWYQGQLPNKIDKQLADPQYMALLALQKSQTLDTLSQSLGGLHDALLMQRRLMELDIDDPLAFRAYRSFTKEVAQLLGGGIPNAPLLFNEFMPIRTGALQLERLRLLDTFGRMADLDWGSIHSTELFQTDQTQDLVFLLPRLSQAARLNFRWMTANLDQQEMNSIPASSPINGWLLPNNLDRSLMLYAADGELLGILSSQATDPWVLIPGQSKTTPVDQLDNATLVQIVQYLLLQQQNSVQAGGNYLSDFIDALNSAAANSNPENYAQHAQEALLFGQPLAIVRANLNLELYGAPAIDQSWNALRLDMQRSGRETNGFTQVQFPLRLGEFQQQNDGLAGYWIDDGTDWSNNPFYAPQSTTIGDDRISTHEDQAVNLYLSPDGPTLNVVMLLNPLGSVHAISGILPAKELSIPPAQYSDALQNIRVAFFSAPLLTLQNQIKLPLQKLPGFSWSWTQPEGQDWIMVNADRTVRQQDIDLVFGSNKAWDDLIKAGWLSLSANDQTLATIVSTAQRPPEPKNLKDFLSTADDLLNQLMLSNTTTNAAFEGPQELREGWLLLNPNPDTNP